MDLGLEGKKAIVGASTTGLGYKVAQRLALEGCTVAISGSNRGRLDRAAAKLAGVVPILADLTTVGGAQDLVAEAADALDGIDILVCNVPGPAPGGTSQMRVSDYERAFRELAVPCIAMVDAAVPGMRESGWGRILAVTSITVRQPIPDLVLSTTARAAFSGYLKTLALDIAQDGVTVNRIEPGLHATKRVDEVYGDSPVVSEIPTGKLGDPGDFADIAAFLCSRQARYVTGTSLIVDGGLHRSM